MVLCQAIPSPPPDVPPFPEAMPGTARQKLAMHRAVEPCKSCHSVMDPIGLGLENFDGIGVFRTTDAGMPIDASGDLDGTTFGGPRELATAIKNHPDATTCLARSMYRYALGHVEGNGEEDSITLLAKDFKDQTYKFRALLEGVVKSPGFAYAAKAQ
jgi:hypothetical protein